jgi:hypothetical protein
MLGANKSRQHPTCHVWGQVCDMPDKSILQDVHATIRVGVDGATAYKTHELCTEVFNEQCRATRIFQRR